MSFPDTDRVLVVIARTRHKMILAELEEAARRNCKFLELRLDFLKKAVDFKRLAMHKKCPWVGTFRRTTEGGRHPLPEEERLAVMRQAIVSGNFEWIDLETDVADSIRRFGKVKRIISYHNMAETPQDLEAIYEKMLKQDGDVYKISVLANQPMDLERIFKIQKNAPKPTVAFCMGEIGLPTRYTALKFGAPWIYAAFNRDRGIAPGLPSIDDFRTTFPVRSINAETEFFGVVGDPIGHSLSPLLHNHMYLRSKVNAVYVPMKVPRGMLGDAIRVTGAVPFSGFSVTIPHKQDAAQLAQETEPFVKLSNSANTLVRRISGDLFAANTDHGAAVESLKSYLNEWYPDGDAPELNQMSILILGSGGAARAVAHSFHKEGAAVTIAARDVTKTQEIADEIHCKSAIWEARHDVIYDVVINCTSVGMHPNLNESPFHRSGFHPGRIAFDIIYNPETTLFIREAKEVGCKVITGIDMFCRQAAKQMDYFLNLTPDIPKMRDIVRKALSPITRNMEEDIEGNPIAQPADQGSEAEDENTTGDED